MYYCYPAQQFIPYGTSCYGIFTNKNDALQHANNWKYKLLTSGVCCCEINVYIDTANTIGGDTPDIWRTLCLTSRLENSIVELHGDIAMVFRDDFDCVSENMWIVHIVLQKNYT